MGQDCGGRGQGRPNFTLTEAHSLCRGWAAAGIKQLCQAVAGKDYSSQHAQGVKPAKTTSPRIPWVLYLRHLLGLGGGVGGCWYRYKLPYLLFPPLQY